MAHRDGHGPEVTPESFTQDALGLHARTPPGYKKALWVTGLLFLLGIIGFVLRAAGDGFERREPWGYFAATVAYLLGTAVAAPLVAVALRLVKAHWRRPMVRIAEVYSVVGLLVLLMFVPLLFLVPSAAGRRTLWLQAEPDKTLGSLGVVPRLVLPGAPHVYITILLASLVLCALALLWLSARPDLAMVRDARGGRLRGLGGWMAGKWRGSRKEWKVHRAGVGLLGGFFFLLLVGTVAFFSVDFALALVPGWKDSVFPAAQALSALQGGLATVVFTLYLVRRFGHLERYIHMEHFWGASKILLALSLLWFYFWWSGFVVFWYGRLPVEQNLLQLLMFGPYRPVFLLAFALNFLAPFLTLLWNGVRRSTWGPPLAAFFILVGTFLDKVRIYVAAYSVEDIAAHTLEKVPPAHLPDVFDLMIMAGGVSGGIFLFLVAARLVPIFSLWEMAEGFRLRAVRPFLRTRLVVLGKPD
ncbi:MAG: hypothetical protein HY535_06880 [Chloroflexi bacterium]|nr:hypothetical protein [Chloroflexota bacterium]